MRRGKKKETLMGLRIADPEKHCGLRNERKKNHSELGNAEPKSNSGFRIENSVNKMRYIFLFHACLPRTIFRFVGFARVHRELREKQPFPPIGRYRLERNFTLCGLRDLCVRHLSIPVRFYFAQEWRLRLGYFSSIMQLP